MNKGFRIEKRRIGKAVVYMVLILLALYTLFPLLILVINSFKPHTDIIANPLAWPRPVDIGFVIKALRELKFTQSFFVTLFITTISILMIVMASSLAAWAMIRNKTVYSKLVFYIFIAAMLVPFQAVMFPLLNVFEKIGMKNIWGACYHVWRIRNEYVDFPLSWIYEKCSGIIGGGSCIGWRRCYSDIFKGGISPG